jgi:ACR3 family arsenite efflux pump ArsB
MWTTLQWIQKNLALSIPAAMLLGLGYGSMADASTLKAAILPLTFLMVYPMMVNLNMAELRHLQGVKTQGLALGLNFLAIPALGYALGLVFFPDEPWFRLGLLLTALLPTSGMTISWTGMAKGNMAAAVRMTVLGLLLGSLLAPLYLQTLMGTVVAVPMGQVFVQIAVVVFFPLVLGTITQKILIARHGQQPFNHQIKPKFAPFSTLGVLGIVFVSMALKSQDILSHPLQIASLLLPLLALYAINFALSTLLGRWLLPRGDAIALVYGTVMRNLSIALAIAMSVFGTRGAEVGLLIALAYIVQVQAAAWYVKWTPILFPPATQAAAT